MKEIVSHPWLDEVMESIRSPLSNLRIAGNSHVKEEINSKSIYHYEFFYIFANRSKIKTAVNKLP